MPIIYCARKIPGVLLNRTPSPLKANSYEANAIPPAQLDISLLVLQIIFSTSYLFWASSYPGG